MIFKERVIVNATALAKSGALTILKQFVNNASLNTDNHYTCFVPQYLFFENTQNITFIEVKKMSWLGRIVWDSYKLNKYLTAHGIVYTKVISLQNTTVNVNVNAEQIVYLHQPLPFSSIKWSFFKRNQVKFFLYKHFYSFFIFLFANNQTIFIVQTRWMKEALSSKFNVKNERIHVIRPDINLPRNFSCKVNESKERVLLYPATPLFYKNHMLIVEALRILKELGTLENIKFQVTFDRDSYPSFSQKVIKYDLTDNVEYLGVVKYEDLLKKYHYADIVLFPSYIETFGLPLAEAASFGKTILCSDLPFSRDVLNAYPGAVYLNYQDPKEWAKAITLTLGEIDVNHSKTIEFRFEQSSSWKDFFKLL